MSKVYVVPKSINRAIKSDAPFINSIFDMIREGDLLGESFNCHIINFGDGLNARVLIDQVEIFSELNDAYNYARHQLQAYAEGLRARAERVDALLGKSHEEI